MLRFALFALSLTAATSAAAQDYRSSLPLTVAERRALEIRLSTILDFARENQIQRIDLPGGGQAAVRAYRLVRGPDGRLCRGYRIDMDGQAGRSAVDGYRCRTTDGRAWVIAQPETVIAQAAPLDLRRSDATPQPPVSDAPGSFAERMRNRLGNAPTHEDLNDYAERQRLAEEERNNPSLFGPGEVPPVPRMAPERPADGGAPSRDPFGSEDSFGGTDVATETSPRENTGSDDTSSAPSISARPVTSAAAVERDAEETPAIGEAPAPSNLGARVVGSPVATDGAPADATGGTAPARDVAASPPGGSTDVAAADGARVVGGRSDAGATDTAMDERVVAALQELDYLGAGTETTETMVNAAIDDFARDERFALPVPSSTLLTRLNEALDRSGSLPICGDGMQTMCIAP